MPTSPPGRCRAKLAPVGAVGEERVRPSGLNTPRGAHPRKLPGEHSNFSSSSGTKVSQRSTLSARRRVYTAVRVRTLGVAGVRRFVDGCAAREPCGEDGEPRHVDLEPRHKARDPRDAATEPRDKDGEPRRKVLKPRGAATEPRAGISSRVTKFPSRMARQWSRVTKMASRVTRIPCFVTRRSNGWGGVL